MNRLYPRNLTFTEADEAKIKKMLGNGLPNPEIILTPNIPAAPGLPRALLKASLRIRSNTRDEIGSVVLYIINPVEAHLGSVRVTGVLGRYQGLGYGKKMMRNIRDVIETYDISTLTVNARLERGGYAWALYGFVPYQQDWNRLRKILEVKVNAMAFEKTNELLESHELKPLTQESFDAAKHLILTLLRSKQASNPKAIWAVADSALGNVLLSGNTWNGKLDCRDARSMMRFNDYVLRGRDIPISPGKETQI